MKKNNLIIIVLVLIILGLVGFIVWDKVLNNKIENSDKSTNTPDTSEYAAQYIQVIDRVKDEYPNSDIKCDLIYFDNNNIPDLVVSHVGAVSLYVYENGTLYNPVETWPFGVMGNAGYSYKEKSGIIINYNSDLAGLIMNKTYSILNSSHEFDTLSYSGEGAKLEPSNPNYEELKKQVKDSLDSYGGYYYNNKKITEQEFNNKIKELSISTNDNNYKLLVGTKTVEEVKKELK